MATEQYREVAWAGGFFEGEGCIASSRKSVNTRTKRGISLLVGNTDLDSLRRFTEAVGTGKINGPHHQRAGTKPMYRWSLSRLDAVLDVLSILWPYLSSRRQVRALEAIAAYGATPVLTRGTWNRRESS